MRKLASIGSLLVLAGCGNAHNDPVPVTELGPRIGAVLCDTITDCYGATLGELFAGGGADCEASFEATYREGTLPLYEAAIAEGTLVYDGTAIGACEDALRAVGCDLTATRFQDLCEDALGGTLTAGQACSIDEECMGPSYCDHSGGACPGTCQARGAAGATCTEDGGCVSGLACQGGTCRAPGGDGASCEGMTGVRCGGGLICQGSSGTTAGTCTPVDEAFSAALGAACDVMGGPLCQEGLSCAVDMVGAAGATFTCVSPSAAGAACRLAVPDACPAGQYCEGVSVMTLDFDGTCAPFPGAGMPCGGLLSRCADGTRCNDGTCQAVSDNGGTCATGANCWSNTCVGGTCTAPMLCGG